jgi:hypothetical protein
MILSDIFKIRGVPTDLPKSAILFNSRREGTVSIMDDPERNWPWGAEFDHCCIRVNDFRSI